MRRLLCSGCGFVEIVTWRVGNVCCFGEQVGHALGWQIKRNSNRAAALLRRAAGSAG